MKIIPMNLMKENLQDVLLAYIEFIKLFFQPSVSDGFIII